jgi:hypothetical protein
LTEGIRVDLPLAGGRFIMLHPQGFENLVSVKQALASAIDAGRHPAGRDAPAKRLLAKPSQIANLPGRKSHRQEGPAHPLPLV